MGYAFYVFKCHKTLFPYAKETYEPNHEKDLFLYAFDTEDEMLNYIKSWYTI